MKTLLNTQQVATELVNLCRKGQFEEAINRLYADNIVSIESMPDPETGSPQVQGKQACLQKSQQWLNMHQVHSIEISAPLTTETHFVAKMQFDITVKETGWRGTIEELSVYEVQDGKIVKEQFFYQMGPKA